jgi:hypothetical protein
MYATGSTFALCVNLLLAYLKVLPPLSMGVNSDISLTLTSFLLEILNAVMPLTAVVFDRPIKATITAASYVFIGLFIWTTKYEMATGGGF